MVYVVVAVVLAVVAAAIVAGTRASRRAERATAPVPVPDAFILRFRPRNVEGWYGGTVVAARAVFPARRNGVDHNLTVEGVKGAPRQDPDAWVFTLEGESLERVKAFCATRGDQMPASPRGVMISLDIEGSPKATSDVLGNTAPFAVGSGLAQVVDGTTWATRYGTGVPVP